MRATLKIVNRTAYRSDHLRAFAVRARDQVFGDEPKRLIVEFRAARRRCHGRASIGGRRSVIWMPPACDRHDLAQMLIHEFAHNAGANGERWMRRGTRFGWGTGWRENVPWALDLPLELAPAKPAPAPSEVVAEKLERIAQRERAWSSKAKRAATALKKLARQRRYYERKLAAGGGA
jgi:hypothetical protein